MCLVLLLLLYPRLSSVFVSASTTQLITLFVGSLWVQTLCVLKFLSFDKRCSVRFIKYVVQSVHWQLSVHSANFLTESSKKVMICCDHPLIPHCGIMLEKFRVKPTFVRSSSAL